MRQNRTAMIATLRRARLPLSAAIAFAVVAGSSMFVGGPATAFAASITVNSVNDAVDASPGDGMCQTATPGECTLRAAIQEANALPGPHTISLPAGSYLLTIAGSGEDQAASGDLDINRSLSVIGAGADTTTIDGGALDRVFDIGPAPAEASVTVTVSGVTIRNGANVSGGGGIQNRSSSLTIKAVVVRDNSASSGGGIANGGTLTIDSSTVTNNAATGEGGGISSGMVTILDSDISLNTSGSVGGGLFLNGQAVIRNSVFNQNSTGGSGHGGAIFSHAHSSSDLLDITDSTFSSNHTGGLGGGIGSENGGTVALTDSTLTDNSGSYGGAVWSGSGLVITRTTASGNRAATGGGFAITPLSTGATFSDSTLSANSATGDGGGIYVTSVTVALKNVTATGNIADSDSNGTGDGGGVFQGSGSALSSSNSIIAGNTDIGGQAPDCAGTVTSAGYNLIQDTTGCAVAGDTTGNIIGQPSSLGPLANNGGVTKTHALLPGSVALDAGNPAAPGSGGTACEATDQRGISRPQGLRCDIGAYEKQPATPSVGGIAEQPNVAALPSRTSAASSARRMAYSLGGAVLAALATVGAGGWYVRRKQAA